MKSNRVHFRLSDRVFVRYSSQAQSQDMALGSYLRWRLEQQDEFLAREETMMKRSVSQALASPAAAPGSPGVPPGLLVEVLLLLRTLAGPQKATVAQKEVERRGLELWR